MEGGTALSDALQAIMIVGRVMRDKVIPPTKDVDLGRPNTFNKTPSANNPNTMDGFVYCRERK